MSLMLLKEFIKLHVNRDMDIKNVEIAGLNTSNDSVFLNKQNFKDRLMEYRCVCFNKHFQQKFDEFDIKLNLI